MRVLNTLIDKNTEDIESNEDAICELSENMDTNIADIENALCELTEEE